MIPPARRALCDLCKRELDIRDLGVHQWTSGWVKLREGGGGHGISCAVREPRWAHSWCVDRLAKGFLKQETLL